MFSSGRFGGRDDEWIAHLCGEVAKVDDRAHGLAVRDDGDTLAGALRFLLEQDQELQSGRVDVADLQEVKFKVTLLRERVEQEILLFERMLDCEIFIQRKPVALCHGGSGLELFNFFGLARGGGLGRFYRSSR